MNPLILADRELNVAEAFSLTKKEVYARKAFYLRKFKAPFKGAVLTHITELGYEPKDAYEFWWADGGEQNGN